MSNYMASQKVVVVDMDDTIVMHDLSEYQPRETISYGPGDIVVSPNQKNINLLVKLYKLDYTIVAWSRTGSDWARAVCQKLDIDKYVSLYMTKPMFYIDDVPADGWMKRLWRDPVTGKEDK